MREYPISECALGTIGACVFVTSFMILLLGGGKLVLSEIVIKIICHLNYELFYSYYLEVQNVSNFLYVCASYGGFDISLLKFN